MANLQLAEIEAYDRLLWFAGAFVSRSHVATQRARQLLVSCGNFRIDLARFSDELSHITKFSASASRAHYENNLARSILRLERTWMENKNLDELYQLLSHDRITDGC